MVTSITIPLSYFCNEIPWLTTIAAVLLVCCGPDIHEAVKAGNIEAVKKHIAAGVAVNAKDNYGMTPLHEAAVRGYNVIAELLITKKAAVNVINDTGNTALD